MFKIIISKNVAKFYESLDDETISRINKAIEEISMNPFLGINIKKLKGELKGFYRYKIGDKKIVYSIDDKIKIVSIVWIGNRKDAY